MFGFHERNLRLPLYESSYRRFSDVEKKPLLMPLSELAEGTYNFIDSFATRIRDGNLPKTIFFLDKSARPVAYIFRKLFPVYCPEIPSPVIRFINIGQSGIAPMSYEMPFNGPASVIKDIYGEHIDINATILIIDEWSQTGSTIKKAEELLSDAFPKATIRSQIAYKKLPSWYGSEYLGVKEYVTSDYADMAEQEYVRQTGKELGSGWWNNPEFIKIKNELWGTIPYAKRGERKHMNKFRTLRKELDILCEAVVKKYPPHKTLNKY